MQIRRVILLTFFQCAAGNLFERIIPAFWSDDDIVEIQFYAVFYLATIGIAGPFILRAQQTAFVSCIKTFYRFHIGIVTATHQFIKDNQFPVEFQGRLARYRHATSVTTAIERAYPTCIVFIGSKVTVFSIIEYNVRLQWHRHTLHIAGKHRFVGQTDSAVCLIQTQECWVNHLLTVVAKEHLVGNDVRAYLQLYQWLRLLGGQRCTVTSYEDRTLDDGWVVGISTFQVERYLLGIRTEGVEGFGRGIVTLTTEEEIAIGVITFHGFRIGIWVSAITTAIDITIDSSMDTDGITTIDNTGYVVTTIYIINMSSIYQHTG